MSDVVESLDLGEKFSWVDQSDPEFRRALDSILHSKDDLFICGAAGTGKSVLVQIAYSLLKGNTLVTASTGISSAALQDAGIPAATIHCALEIPSHDFFNSQTRIDKGVMKAVAKIDTLIIDEISMVSCSLLDQVQRVINRATRGTEHRVRLILFGDVLQLPPVVDSSDSDVVSYYRDNYDGHSFFFHSKTWKRRGFTTFHLYKIFRQSETSLQNVLNRMRLGVQSEADVRLFDGRVVDFEEFIGKHRLCLVLASTNRVVDAINQKYGIPKDKNGKPTRYIDYHARITGSYDLMKNSDTVRMTERIYLGQQVMCTRNRPEDGYMNGTLGIVRDLGDSYVLIEKADGTRVRVTRVDWVQTRVSYDEDSGKISYHDVGRFNQIACRAAKAVTIHKAQGMTLDSVYLYLEGSSWIPDSGIYLALSRCRTYEGIGLSRQLRMNMIHIDEEALQFLLDEEDKRRHSLF